MPTAQLWRSFALAALLAAPPAAAQPDAAPPKSEPSAAAVAAAAEDTREALARLEEASDYLAALAAYEFEAEFAYDAVQSTGQKLEFGGTRKILVRRPDRVRAEGRNRQGEESLLTFDGKTLAMAFPDDHAYVSLEKPGTLNEVIDYIENDLGTPMYFDDLVYAGFYADVSPRIRHGIYVGDETVAGVSCAHLAFSAEASDFEVWIETSNRPLVRRIVIDYTDAPRHPQFRAQILKWNLSPDAGDAHFVFRPPKGAERLPILAVSDLRTQARGAAERSEP